MSELAKQIESLMKLPQSLCDNCGSCCKISIFKGGLTYKEVLELSKSKTEKTSQVEGAKDFLKTFTPFENTAKAREKFPEFVERMHEHFNKKEGEIDFFYCRYVDENNLCMIHEDRPLFCRAYPLVHERTIYFPNCGYKKQGEKNWKEIKKILDGLGINYDGN